MQWDAKLNIYSYLPITVSVILCGMVTAITTPKEVQMKNKISFENVIIPHKITI